MHKLTVLRGAERSVLEFEGEALLADVLARGGFAVLRPCGGRGSCGKCAVELEGRVSPPNAAEERAGQRLACQTVLLGDARVRLPEARAMEQIEMSGGCAPVVLRPMAGSIGAAADIGTTTLALKLYDLRTGACIAEAGMLNPQTETAADVMGRIAAALDGRLDELQRQVQTALQTLLDRACAQAGAGGADAMVITGNTTMLYLLTGRRPDTLARAPFTADWLFGEYTKFGGAQAYLPPCMNAFVGADISCAVLSSGMCSADETALLIDIGTNGEIALWKDGTLFVSSTAAGPAFEGAGISCGCGSVRGAVDRVWLEDGALKYHTIGEAPAAGVCGSGLIDAMACFLETGAVDETGATELDELCIAEGAALQPEDVRAVQLAKAAIAAGIDTLLETAGAVPEEIGTLYIAGGFGSRLNVGSAVRIGLIPELPGSRIKVLGNAALAGAAQLLLDRDAPVQGIAEKSRHVNLGGNPRFSEHYMDRIFFPEA